MWKNKLKQCMQAILTASSGYPRILLKKYIDYVEFKLYLKSRKWSQIRAFLTDARKKSCNFKQYFLKPESFVCIIL